MNQTKQTEQTEQTKQTKQTEQPEQTEQTNTTSDFQPNIFTQRQQMLRNHYPQSVNAIAVTQTVLPVFSKEECNMIIQLGNSKNLDYTKAGTGMPNLEIFTSKSAYIDDDSMEGFFDRIEKIVKEDNEKYWRFTLNTFAEAFKFLEYSSEYGGKEAIHADLGDKPIVRCRKLTVIVQLSDPADYEGGDLIIHMQHTPSRFTRQQGNVIIFPTFMLHEVSPVTKGVRNSLIAYVHGPPFA